MTDVKWVSIEDAHKFFHVTVEELSRAEKAGEIDSKMIEIRGMQYLHFMDHQLAKVYERRLKKNELTETASKAVVGAAVSAPIAVATIVAAGQISRKIQASGNEQKHSRNLENANESQSIDQTETSKNANRLLRNLLEEREGLQPSDWVILADDDEKFCDSAEAAIGRYPDTVQLHATSDFDELTDCLAQTSHLRQRTVLFLDLDWYGSSRSSLNLLQHLSNPDFAHVFVVILSRTYDPIIVEDCYNAGANLFVHKGFEAGELRNFLNALRFLVEDNSGVLLPGTGREVEE